MKSVSKLSPILEKLTLHYPLIVSYTALGSSIVFWGICDFETNFNELAYGNRQKIIYLKYWGYSGSIDSTASEPSVNDTAKRILERLGIQTSSSFVKI